MVQADFQKKEINRLVAKANKTYQQNFLPTTSFERAIFFSWGCTVGDCAFCYMSTQPKGKKPKETRRSLESILAEVILCQKLGWDIGFFTGGVGVFSSEEMEFLLKSIYEITQKKIWLSVGPLSKELLEKYQPYIKGVVGSIETINPKLHKKICPSKPLEPYEKMFEEAQKLNLLRAMTFIVGIGETKEDWELLKKFMEKYEINKIHVYGLIPEKKTIFEKSSFPSAEEQAWWIAQLRINFPKLNIQGGIWEDRVERTSLLLKVGANSLSKFRALKLFGTSLAKEIEHQAFLAGREFQGTLTKIPKMNEDVEVEKLSFEKGLKRKIKEKLKEYLESMKRNCQRRKTFRPV